MPTAGPENTVHIIGNLTEDPDLRFTPNGHAVANLRVAVNARVFNKDAGDFEDRTDGFFTVNVWRDQAENVADSLHKGDRVAVVGRLRSRSYENKEGETRWVTEIEADDVSPSLRWARADVNRVRGGTSSSAPRQDEAPPLTDDDVPF